MGHRTSISDYEMDRAWTRGPEVEGYDVEAVKSETKSKKVEAEKKPAPTTSGVAKTKAK